MSHTPDEAIAKEVADKLLDRIPEDAHYTGGANTPERCRALDPTHKFYCTRLGGHLGEHVSLNKHGRLHKRWRQKEKEELFGVRR